MYWQLGKTPAVHFPCEVRFYVHQAYSEKGKDQSPASRAKEALCEKCSVLSCEDQGGLGLGVLIHLLR